MTSSGSRLVVSVTEVQFACFGSRPLSCSAATSIRRVSYGLRRRVGPAALPDALWARQLKRRAASIGLLVLFRMKSCGRSVVPGGNAKAGSGFESANIGARKVHTAVFAKSLCSSLTRTPRCEHRGHGYSPRLIYCLVAVTWGVCKKRLQV